MNSVPAPETADRNTTGLAGLPDKDGTSFHSPAKASGVTAKDTDGPDGSFGMGENASFAVSDPQTVFCAMTYGNGDSEAFAAQGKVKLVSRTGKDGDVHGATGYWGDPDGFRAVTGRAPVPDWMMRTETGTPIFRMGFRAADGRAERMTCSPVPNFFRAVRRERMAFAVDGGKTDINRNTIEGRFAWRDLRPI